ncbi:MAG: UTP--glucose-1-phosphate uridylyltransferase [Pirellulales bacterium]|nr:UTP--glucose-1-phosphate uridylyltransferase [Pirellulales bacterium]
MTEPDPSELARLLRAHDQEHLLAGWDQLSADRRRRLADQINEIDFPLLERLARGDDITVDWATRLARAAPPPAIRLHGANRISAADARAAGQQALRAGRVAALLVAGGQGTRLGFEHAKGMYPIGPVSGASLFQILFEKLLAVRRRYGAAIPLFLMTSPATHQETVEYLDHVRRFGLPAEDLFVFCQGTMPAIDAATGRVLLAAPGEIALSPDGHGGMLAALERTGGLTELRGRGIEQLFYMQVDNPLVSVCDAEFLGYQRLAAADLVTQAVAKRAPRDKVGNILSIDSRLEICEYSEFNTLGDELIARRAADGALVFWAGSTAVHAFDVAFLVRMEVDAERLPFHRAHKKVPFVDQAGKLVEPGQPNALKFERFIFDLLPSAETALVVEVDEQLAFAPLKNTPGEPRDTPESVQAQMSELYASWLREAGLQVAPGTPVEISPLLALDAADVRAQAADIRRKLGPASAQPINQPVYLRRL